MSAVGLIVEYNPFHNGHLYHLKQAKQLTTENHVIAVMSGHFLQRGEPALLDKWTRTKMALAGGCDLVLELPTIYATSSAEWFAYGAVATLEATGVVNHLCFGTEAGQLDPLQRAAHLLADEPTAFSEQLAIKLKEGLAYPVAFSQTVTDFVDCENTFRFDLPNHTLGLHYLIALKRLQSRIKPHTIAREQAQYHDSTFSTQSIASATAIRKALLETKHVNHIANVVPQSTLSILNQLSDNSFLSWSQFTVPLFYQLLTQSANDLTRYREVSEGLEHRIKSVLPHLQTPSFECLLELLKTKRYTKTKLQRLLLSILLQHTKEASSYAHLKHGVSYIRVLGFSDKGRQLLKEMKKTATVPVIHSPKQLETLPHYLQLDIAATSIYRLGQQQHGKPWLDDYHQPPIQL